MKSISNNTYSATLENCKEYLEKQFAVRADSFPEEEYTYHKRNTVFNIKLYHSIHFLVLEARPGYTLLRKDMVPLVAQLCQEINRTEIAHFAVDSVRNEVFATIETSFRAKPVDAQILHCMQETLLSIIRRYEAILRPVVYGRMPDYAPLASMLNREWNPTLPANTCPKVEETILKLKNLSSFTTAGKPLSDSHVLLYTERIIDSKRYESFWVDTGDYISLFTRINASVASIFVPQSQILLNYLSVNSKIGTLVICDESVYCKVRCHKDNFCIDAAMDMNLFTNLTIQANINEISCISNGLYDRRFEEERISQFIKELEVEVDKENDKEDILHPHEQTMSEHELQALLAMLEEEEPASEENNNLP